MVQAQERSGRLERGDGVELAWAHLPGAGPTVVFLPGFKSDMAGSKATELRDWCASQGRAMLRLDYSGHGESGGAFTDGTIGPWAADARLGIETGIEGPARPAGPARRGVAPARLAAGLPRTGWAAI